MDWLEYTNNRPKFNEERNLNGIRRALELLGNPQDDYKVIHVGGTNGKGSFSNYLYNIMKQKYKVGLFTSPHIERFNERIKVDDEISDEDIENIMVEVKEVIESENLNLTTFDIIFVLAATYFSRQKVEYAIVEVGIGGIVDSTNVIKNTFMQVIMTISFDHVDLLGNTLEEIATKKAGIIRENGNLFSLTDNEVLLKTAKEKNSKVTLFKDHKLEYNLSDTESDFTLDAEDYQIKMLGKHQVEDASMAVLVSKELGFSYDEIREGLLKAHWPVRFETVSQNPRIVIDGSHNLEGVETLKETLKLVKRNKIIGVIGLLSTKDIHVIDLFNDIIDYLIVTPIEYGGFDPKEIEKHIEKEHLIAKDYKEAINLAIKTAADEDLILVAGSLYLAGAMKKYIKYELELK